MINLDYQSRTPIYEQIVTEIEKYVVLGIFKPKEQIMSIRELAETLGVNPNTVKKAYSELERKGVIQTISTKGNFISDNIDNVVKRNVDEKIEDLKRIILELEKLGIDKKDILSML